MKVIPGVALGRYRIVSRLGAGGMGEVFAAQDATLGRQVAIKVLPERVAADPAARHRFERETRMLASLSHPNLLAIHDFGEEQDVVFAVTELLEGQTLRARLRQGRLEPAMVLDVARAMAAGLAAAHGRGIVHRDLKPENVFIGQGGSVKILDFGIARALAPEAADDAATRAGFVTQPGNPERDDLTLELWIEMITELSGG
jgi:serine/threonine protein kinase